MTSIKPSFRVYSLLLLIALFIGISLRLPAPAHAQDSGPVCPPEFVKCLTADEVNKTPADYSDLLGLLRALSGPLLLPAVGLLVSTFSERWKWFQDVDGLTRNIISAVVAVVIAIGSLLLLNWLQTVPADALAQVQTYFSVAFLAVTSVLARDLWHANVNKPLAAADKAKV